MGRLGARRLVLLAACLGLCGARGALGGTRLTSPPGPLPGRAAPASRGWASRDEGAGWGPPGTPGGPRESAPRPCLELSGRAFLGWAAGRRLLGPALGVWAPPREASSSRSPPTRPAARGPAPPVQGSPGVGAVPQLRGALAADRGFQSWTPGCTRNRANESCRPPF